MATPTTLRPLLRARPRVQIQTPCALALPTFQQRRTFLPNPFASLNPLSSNTTTTPQTNYQTLTASRTLPYPPPPIYTIISDIPSYPHFLPYCQSATITKFSSPDPTYHRVWPSEAEIVVGFGAIRESFISKIFCVPGRVVESVGGGTETSLREKDILHHLQGTEKEAGRAGRGRGEGGLLTHLRSRWTLEPLPGTGKKSEDGGEAEATRVSLSLEFAFANPIYETLSAGAAPRVADVMIKAFEERVRFLLENNPELARAKLGDPAAGKV